MWWLDLTGCTFFMHWCSHLYGWSLSQRCNKTLVRLHVWKEAPQLLLGGRIAKKSAIDKKIDVSMKWKNWLVLHKLPCSKLEQKRIASNFKAFMTFLYALLSICRGLLNTITVTIHKNVWLANNSIEKNKTPFIWILNWWRMQNS